MENHSARHGLPYLFTGQAGKEITHNEALARIDVLLQPVVESKMANPPDISGVSSGQCWLVADGALAEWAGHENDIACWMDGSWRFVAATLAMRVYNRATASHWIFLDGSWSEPAVISDVNGGANIDVEARAAINALLEQLRFAGAIAM